MGSSVSIVNLEPNILEPTTEEQKICISYSVGEDCDDTVDIIEMMDTEVEVQKKVVVLNCECIPELSLLFVQQRLEAFPIHGMSLANNSITTERIEQHGLPWADSLCLLQFGGNLIPLPKLLSFLPQNNSSLVVLDLSFTENFIIGQGFTSDSCKSLRRLVLDGCSLESTLTADGPMSIFLGLSSLSELSLRENNLSSYESLNGLHALHNTLAHLCLEDNPVMEIAAQRSHVEQQLSQHMHRLSTLDKKRLLTGNAPEDLNEMQMGSPVVLKRMDGGSHAISGLSGVGLDQLEREYLAALNNERDTNVVS